MVDFSKLLQASKEVDVSKAIEDEQSKGKFQKDERYYEIPKDKDGNGVSIIRFLPHLEGLTPFVSFRKRFFKHQNKLFGYRCRTSMTNTNGTKK